MSPHFLQGVLFPLPLFGLENSKTNQNGIHNPSFENPFVRDKNQKALVTKQAPLSKVLKDKGIFWV